MMTNDGVRLDYQIFGTGQPIILVEGYSGNQATWVMQVEPLVNAGLQVITYDRRNHGKSDTVDYGMRMARHGQDLAELMAQLRLEKPILMGHSMGASTIWAYLSLYGDANVRAIITEDQLPKILRDDSCPYGIFNADLTMIWTAATKLPHTKLTRLKLSETVKHALADNYQPFDFQYNEPLLLDSLMQDGVMCYVVSRICCIVGKAEFRPCMGVRALSRDQLVAFFKAKSVAIPADLKR
ncbi:hypothetical protein Pfo_031657 [Paulownia fortunei]|nr:hypothetical protein Pfo_031657 [Paulownia fortunei]